MTTLQIFSLAFPVVAAVVVIATTKIMNRRDLAAYEREKEKSTAEQSTHVNLGGLMSNVGHFADLTSGHRVIRGWTVRHTDNLGLGVEGAFVQHPRHRP